MKRYIIVGLFLSLFACSEPVEVEPFTYPQIFTGESQKSWKMRTVQIVRAGKGTLTYPADAFMDNEGETCVSDNIYTFYFDAQRSYKVTEGSTRCDPDASNIAYEGEWAFVNSTATLTILIPGLSSSALPFTIYTVDSQQLSLDIYVSDTDNYRLNFKPVENE